MKKTKKLRVTKEDREIKKITTLYKLTKIMSSSISLNQLLELILKSACDSVAANSGSLMLLDEETNELEIKAFIGLRENIVESLRIKIGERIAGWIAQNGKSLLLLEGLDKYPQFEHFESRPEIKSAICVPLKTRDKVIGVLNVNSLKTSHYLSEIDKGLLTIFAEDAAIVIENAKLYEEITRAKNYTENIIKSIIDILIVVNRDGKIETVNQTTLDLLEYEESELIDKPMGTILAEEELFKGTKLKRLTEEGSVRNYELIFKTKNGERIPVNFSGSVMREPSSPHRGEEKGEGEIVGIVGIARDMRETKQMQAQLIQSAKMAAIGEIGTGIAHQLNSPLAGLSSVINVLRRRLDRKNPSYHFLEEMKEATEYCTKVIRDLLNFTRMSEERFKPVNCNEAINSVLTFTAHQLEVKSIKIVKNLRPNLAPVFGDMSQLQQVFLNMITNARDAMPGGGTLTINTRTKGNENKYVEIEFADTGCGIDPKNVGRIFEPFFSTKNEQRVGLGLSISNEIIKKHRGNIEVKSEMGKGTVLTVKLPTGE